MSDILKGKVIVVTGATSGIVRAIAEGTRNTGAEVDVKQVPATVPEKVARSAHFKLDQAAAIATVAEFESYDEIIVGTGTPTQRLQLQSGNTSILRIGLPRSEYPHNGPEFSFSCPTPGGVTLPSVSPGAPRLSISAHTGALALILPRRKYHAVTNAVDLDARQ